MRDLQHHFILSSLITASLLFLVSCSDMGMSDIVIPDYPDEFDYEIPGDPGAPHLSIGILCGGGYVFSWSKLDDAYEYILGKSETPDFHIFEIVYKGNGTGYNPGPPPGYPFYSYYRVRARTYDGETGWSNAIRYGEVW